MTIADLYPNLSPDELKEAEYNLHEYFKVAMKMAEKSDLKHAIENRESKEQLSEPEISRSCLLALKSYPQNVF
jgi:hypothetical protein